MRNPTSSAAALLSVLMFLTGCAGLSSSRQSVVMVTPSDRLLFEVAPLDSAARADLVRAGLDPARVAEDVATEIRYQLALRGQEEARDAAEATVAVRLTVRRLQPGEGNSGAYGAYLLTEQRGKAVDSAAWETRGRPRENVPQAFVARHLARTAASEALARMKPRKGSKEPPPPLVLMR